MKMDTFGITRMRNDVHFQFYTEVLALLERYGDELNLKPEQLAAFHAQYKEV